MLADSICKLTSSTAGLENVHKIPSFWISPEKLSPVGENIHRTAASNRNYESFHRFLLIVILNLACSRNMADDWSFSLTLYSLPPSLVFRSIPAENVCAYACVCVCVCVCVAETAREACNWVCPPTALQQRQRGGWLHCVRHNGYVHILITRFHGTTTLKSH